MAFELVLLGALLFIFIVSFCGLLQKIKQTYDRERLLAGSQNQAANRHTSWTEAFHSPMDAMAYTNNRIARRREQERTQRGSTDSFSEVYTNPAYNSDTNGVIFPAAPPPYSQYYVEPPPKYDEVVKVHQSNSSSEPNEPAAERRSSTETGPPPYTINLTLVNEAANRQ